MNSQTDSTSVVPLGQSSDVSSDVVYAHGVPALETPGCNTGVSVTSSRLGMDYFRFTVPSELANGLCCDELLALLMLDSLPLVVEHKRGGMMFWRCSATFGPGARIAWGGNGDTACVDLSGGALGYLAAIGLDVLGWASFVVDLGCRVTRWDLALDDEDGRITADRVRSADLSGGMITRARVSDEIKRRRGGKGWTYYIGGRSSEVFVRIYDKAAEQKLPEACKWMRLEVEYKGRKAQVAFQRWRSAGYSARYGLSLVRGAVDFRVPSATDSNVSRWALCDWWAAIVEDVGRVRLAVGAITRTIENVAGWLHGSVAGAFAAFHEVYGADAVQHLIEHGRSIMSADHRRMVALASG